ncbi:hypothetical protein POM88_025183 [Heracleum sosnowskyi]|uniref:Uncharacterized protein n=1 Tax=Heracleum sosnowskyi TaxID=360622 RepID=A0AAD8MMY5_9APIA|nr:hypothetical protein POM88_034192 [Heracleum sosnowskyi]KAK1378439.1 hypothetical protein POM88_025183 [Heracleum sosnowskyi]
MAWLLSKKIEGADAHISESTDVTVSEEGRGKVAALLKRQGLNVKGLLKATPAKEEPHSFIDCTGNLQVWHVDVEGKTPLTGSSLSKIYRGDCYIFQYMYPGESGDQYLVGTWFGEQSVEVITAFTIFHVIPVA